MDGVSERVREDGGKGRGLMGKYSANTFLFRISRGNWKMVRMVVGGGVGELLCLPSTFLPAAVSAAANPSIHTRSRAKPK